MEKPWVTGPKELIQHALEHLRLDTDFDRRIALISIDNAVELTIKTYLGLPSRVTSIKISRSEYEQIIESYPGLLDALEQHSSDKLIGIDLADLEWYHRLRNKIYHEGIGITVERLTVEKYAEIAKILYQNLFGISIEVPKEIAHTEIGEFINKWVTLEKTLSTLAKLYALLDEERHSTSSMFVRELNAQRLVSKDFVNRFDEIRNFRNNLIHGLSTPSKQQVRDQLSKLTSLLEELTRLLEDEK